VRIRVPESVNTLFEQLGWDAVKEVLSAHLDRVHSGDIDNDEEGQSDEQDEPGGAPAVRRKNHRVSKQNLTNLGYDTVNEVHSTRRAALPPALAKRLKGLVINAHQTHSQLFVQLFESFRKTNDGDRPYEPVADPHRVQISLDSLKVLFGQEEAGLFSSVDRFIEQVLGWMAEHHSDYVVDPKSVQFLLSLPGGKNQVLHTDYTVENAAAFEKVAPGAPPLFVISPLVDDVQLRIAKGPPGKVVASNRGEVNAFHFPVNSEHTVEVCNVPHTDVLVMHGYAAHGGCGYSSPNVRLHFYILPKKGLDAIGKGTICKNTGTLFESKFDGHLGK
jgi:hypothetical protein